MIVSATIAMGCTDVAGFYLILCVHRALRQRKKLLQNWEKAPTHAREYLESIAEVSFNRHIWYLFTFRDPMRLYHKSLVYILLG